MKTQNPQKTAARKMEFESRKNKEYEDLFIEMAFIINL